jgi:hypothetical protein
MSKVARRTRMRPPVSRVALKLTLGPENLERLEAYCMRRATTPPYEDLKPSAVARRGVLFYLRHLEAEEALLPSRRARPPCVFATGAGGLAWCPEHDERWQIGAEVPESCRGDG